MAARDQEIEELRQEIARAKAANAKLPDRHDYNEEKTRDQYIDLLLREVGWKLDGTRDREFPLAGMPSATGQGYVDYVLWGDDGKPLGLVEAKRTKRSPHDGQAQAKLYADCLEKAYGQRPVIFLSNGYEHWIWDDLEYPPREVQGFYSKDELALLIQRRETKKPLKDASINDRIVNRPYQHRAIRNVTEAFEKQKERKVLLVMATGSGKTRTAAALVDLMVRCNWVRRALFLAGCEAKGRGAQVAGLASRELSLSSLRGPEGDDPKLTGMRLLLILSLIASSLAPGSAEEPPPAVGAILNGYLMQTAATPESYRITDAQELEAFVTLLPKVTPYKTLPASPNTDPLLNGFSPDFEENILVVATGRDRITDAPIFQGVEVRPDGSRLVHFLLPERSADTYPYGWAVYTGVLLPRIEAPTEVVVISAESDEDENFRRGTFPRAKFERF